MGVSICLNFCEKKKSKITLSKDGAQIRYGYRSCPRQGIPRDEPQGACQALEEKGYPAQTRQVRPRDGPRNCRICSVREALFGGVERQEMLEVRQEASRRPRQRKEKARGDASSPP